MAKNDPAHESLADSGAAPTPWHQARDRLANPAPAQTYWLSTVRPDGRPHVMPVIGLWLDDAFYFISGGSTRKGKNLARNPNCVIAVSSTTRPSLDVVLEGKARRLTDPDEVARVAEAYRSVLGWPLEVREGELHGPNAPTAGPPPYAVFEVTPETAFGLPGMAGMNEPPGTLTPTRWRFG